MVHGVDPDSVVNAGAWLIVGCYSTKVDDPRSKFDGRWSRADPHRVVSAGAGLHKTSTTEVVQV